MSVSRVSVQRGVSAQKGVGAQKGSLSGGISHSRIDLCLQGGLCPKGSLCLEWRSLSMPGLCLQGSLCPEGSLCLEGVRETPSVQ